MKMTSDSEPESSSPRSWRCFQRFFQQAVAGTVFSTLVEVFLRKNLFFECGFGLLHARGGVSIIMNRLHIFYTSSPRSWRCFYQQLFEAVSNGVFSTLVEVFP